MLSISEAFLSRIIPTQQPLQISIFHTSMYCITRFFFKNCLITLSHLQPRRIPTGCGKTQDSRKSNSKAPMCSLKMEFQNLVLSYITYNIVRQAKGKIQCCERNGSTKNRGVNYDSISCIVLNPRFCLILLKFLFVLIFGLYTLLKNNSTK